VDASICDKCHPKAFGIGLGLGMGCGVVISRTNSWTYPGKENKCTCLRSRGISIGILLSMINVISQGLWHRVGVRNGLDCVNFRILAISRKQEQVENYVILR
jgi:hypothetical protein